MSEHVKNEHMEEASADLADLQANRRADIAKNAARDIPVEVAESLAGIRRELRGIKIALWILGIIAFIVLAALTAG